jgi:hypothetical protein
MYHRRLIWLTIAAAVIIIVRRRFLRDDEYRALFQILHYAA